MIMNRLVRSCVILFLCGTIISCEQAEKSGEDLDAGSIIGCVTDSATGDQLSNANVQLHPGGEAVLTGYDGMFEFHNLSPGKYSLSISKTEYLDLNDDYIIELTGGRTVRRDVRLQKQVASLMVTDPEGAAISSLDFGSEKSAVSKSFNVFNEGTISIACQLSYSCPWIVSVSTPPNPIYPGQTVNITVVINRELLSAGLNTTYLHISSNNGNKDLQITAIGDTDPVVYLSSVSSIDFEKATLSAKIIEEGLPPYSECGFVVGEDTMPDLYQSILHYSYPPSSSNEYSQRIQGLQPDTKYYARAYIKNENGTFYSDELEFSTKTPELPTAGTLSPGNVYESGATLKGLLGSVGNPTFTRLGFLVSPTESNPEIGNSSPYNATVTYSSGAFEVKLSGLSNNQLYYVRTYAVTPYETVYFNTVQFETKAPFISIEGVRVKLDDESFIEYDYSYQAPMWHYEMKHNEAQKTCDNLVLGKYDDWRLPTLDELKIMYTHRIEIGGFSSTTYWSSTKNSEEGNYSGSYPDGYVSLDFATGKIKYGNNYAGWTERVRAVR